MRKEGLCYLIPTILVKGKHSRRKQCVNYLTSLNKWIWVEVMKEQVLLRTTKSKKLWRTLTVHVLKALATQRTYLTSLSRWILEHHKDNDIINQRQEAVENHNHLHPDVACQREQICLLPGLIFSPFIDFKDVWSITKILLLFNFLCNENSMSLF